MDKEIKAAVMAFTGIALGLLWAIAVFRFVVPSILEAHFYGSLLAGGTVGILGVIGLAVLVYVFFWRAVIRGLSSGDASKEGDNP